MSAPPDYGRYPLDRWIIVAMTTLFYSGFAYTAGTLGIGPVKGWMWVLLFAAVIVPFNLALLRAQITITPLLVWAYCLFAVMLIWTLVAINPMDSVMAIIMYGWYLVVVLITLVMVRTEAARKIAIRTVFLIVIGSVITNLVMAAMGSFRPAGLYGNANTGGYALVMGMIVTHSFIPPRFRFPYQTFILAGIFVTASRASLILWALSVVLLYVMGRDKGYYGRWALATMVVLFGVALSPLGADFLDTLNDADSETARLLSLGSKEELEEDSRVVLAELAWKEVQDHLFLGQGTGKGTVYYDNINWGTHNMYLTFMMQFGVLGVFILPALALVVLGMPSARWSFSVPFAVLLLIAGFFDHNIFDQWHYAFMLALVSSMTGTEFAKAPAKDPILARASSRFALA